MATGKHKRSEVHKGTPLIDTEQISVTVTPETYEWLKSQPGNVSATIRSILEKKFGVFEAENLTPSVAKQAGIRCLDCDYLGIDYEDGTCTSRCYYYSKKGKPVSKCSDADGISGVDLSKRNLERKGAPSWCPKLNEEEEEEES